MTGQGADGTRRVPVGSMMRLLGCMLVVTLGLMGPGHAGKVDDTLRLSLIHI